MRSVLCALLLPVLIAAAPLDERPLVERYHEAAAAGDRDALIEAWRAEPGLVLPTIDQDLEGSLAQIERARESDAPADPAAIEALRARARFGASCADQAFGTRIFEDYAVAFASWSQSEQERFRAGQAAFGRARAALKAGDHAAALAAATECEDLARPLGDWWGTAMGCDARGAAHAALGQTEQAIAAFQEAGLYYHDLRLLGSEYRSLTALADALATAGAKARAARAIEAALALGESLGDAEGVKALRERLEKLR